jgi:tetratricopeptide (TPR) repeat protein
MFDDFAPYSEEEKVYWFQRLREYYQKSKKKERLHREKPIVSILYYDLRCDFLKAFYHNFIRWSEIAIKGCEMELDAQLRNEVLIYMRNDSRHRNTRVNEFETVFIQDSATRWIRRLITQERYDQAIGLAKILLSLGANEYSSFLSSPSLLEIPEDSKKKLESSIINAHPIFWASLLIYYGESLTYLTKEPEKKVENIFQHAIGRLRKSPFGQDHPLWWFRNRLLGRAYDRLGYLARANGHYYKAAEYYRKALPFYEKAEIADEFAFTQNNLAFVLALLGDITGAKNAVENALTRRLEMGQRYPLALSYNTRGLIRALENPNSLDGQRDCELALSIFREIDIPRGIVLACNALGFILRQRGGRWVSKQCTQEKAIHWYSESEKYFEHVIEKFGKGEKIRLWEALNELGSLYRDWAHLLNHLKDPEGARKRFLQSLDFQRQALTLAQENNMRFQQVDTLDDTAETYLNLGDFDKAKKDNNFEEARKNIEGCKALIPPEFNLADAQKEPHPGEVYWLSLAKIQLREGMMNILMARRNLPPDSSRVADGIQQLLISFIYFQLFSKQPKYLEQKVCEILLILKELSIPGKLIGDIFKRVSGEYNFDFTALHSSLSKEYPYDEFS